MPNELQNQAIYGHQAQFAPDSYDMAPQMPEQPMYMQKASTSMISSLFDDPEKKLTLCVLALLIVAQHPQTRDSIRSLTKSAGVQIAGTPYESVIISLVLSAGFYFFLIKYF